MPNVGQTLTRSTGSWTGSPTSYATRWLRGASVISGQTASTYLLTSSDFGFTLRAEVTATNAVGASSPALSAPTATVTNPPPPGVGNPYFANNCLSGIQGPTNQYPASLYVAATNKTWCSWEVGPIPVKAWLRVYNHSAGTWAGPYVVATDGLGTEADSSGTHTDAHGSPVLCGPDANGYMYCFYGAHATSQKWKRTTNPGDPSSWTTMPAISSSLTYPKPLIFGNTLYLFERATVSGYMPPCFSKGTLTNGVWSPVGPSKTIWLTLPSNRRFYHSFTFVEGTKVYSIGRLTGSSRTFDVYDNFAYVFDTADDSIQNCEGTFSTTTYPIPYATFRANVGRSLLTTPSLRNDPHSLVKDHLGNLHFYYWDPGGSNALQILPSGSTTWGAPTSAPLIGHIHRIADGRLSGLTGVAGGYGHLRRSLAGVWDTTATPVILHERPSPGSYSHQLVYNNHAGSRWLICEMTVDIDSNNLRVYLVADAGPINAP